MTIRMKKLLTILLMLTCVLGLTACGQEAKPKFHYDEVSMVMTTGNSLEIINGVASLLTEDQIDENFGSLTDDELDALAESVHNYGLDQTGTASGPKTTGQAFVTGLKSYRSAIEEIGEVSIDISNYEIEEKDKELIVTIPLKGTLHNGTFEVIFDRNLHATSFTTNVEYSLAESMQKAGMNTAIGMGTVFVMLIVIMFIIYGFAIIPKIQASAEAKKQGKTTTEESVDNAIQGIVEREEDVATDDLELIAVIAAAIAASEGASSTDGFVVRSIKRIK